MCIGDDGSDYRFCELQKDCDLECVVAELHSDGAVSGILRKLLVGGRRHWLVHRGERCA